VWIRVCGEALGACVYRGLREIPGNLLGYVFAEEALKTCVVKGLLGNSGNLC